ncbi:hypothetical protein ACKVWM_004214 [Pyricularia oryzae]
MPAASFWSLCPNWIVTKTGLYSPTFSRTLRTAPSHRPCARNDAVVAPLLAVFQPAAPPCRNDRNPSPHPPLTAVVLSPVRTK